MCVCEREVCFCERRGVRVRERCVCRCACVGVACSKGQCGRVKSAFLFAEGDPSFDCTALVTTDLKTKRRTHDV